MNPGHDEAAPSGKDEAASDVHESPARTDMNRPDKRADEEQPLMSSNCRTSPRTGSRVYLTAVIEPEDDGWLLEIWSVTGTTDESLGQSVWLAEWQVKQLGLEANPPCVHMDPEEFPCGSHAIDGSQFCGFHSATTGGLSVR